MQKLMLEMEEVEKEDERQRIREKKGIVEVVSQWLNLSEGGVVIV